MDDTTQLVPVEREQFAPIMPVMAIEQAQQRYQAMVELTKSVLRDGTDFGKVPGTDKPCLLKPGAEKLTTFFGLRPEFEIIEKAEDWTGAEHNGEPFFYYWFRCSLWRGAQKVGEADGSCNSHESKYRWRWVEQSELPPGVDTSLFKCRRGSISEFDFSIGKAETSGKYGKPPEYWQQFTTAIENGTAEQITKRTRDGRQFPAWRIDTTVYRVPNDDIASQVNTVLKMAQKRALIAATLITVNASEFFTQDMEDYTDEFIEGEFTTTVASPPPSTQQQHDDKTEKYIARWHELANEATMLGIQFDKLPENASSARIVEEGQGLAKLIENARARAELWEQYEQLHQKCHGQGIESEYISIQSTNAEIKAAIELLKEQMGDNEHAFDPASISPTIHVNEFYALVIETVPHYKHKNHIINAYRKIQGDDAQLCNPDGTLMMNPWDVWSLLKEHADAHHEEKVA